MRKTPLLMASLIVSITGPGLAAQGGRLPELAPDLPKPAPELLAVAWPAQWIAPPAACLTEYGVFHFRRAFDLREKPARFVVHVSADNRYRLFVNGVSVACGPQAGDVMRWRYDSIDLAPHLRAGRNLLAVEVCNFGELRKYATISLASGLIVQGDGPAERVADTGPEWRVAVDRSRTPVPIDRAMIQAFTAVGPCETFEAARHPWGWETPGFDDSGWSAPRLLGNGLPYGFSTDVARWLVQRSIPMLDEFPQKFAAVRRAEGVAVPEGFLEGRAPIVVPARTKARVLFDQGGESNAYPRAVVSGGRGAAVEVAYAEAMVDAARQKGHRDAVEGRRLIGFADRFLPDGGARREFSTLDYRTFRYVEARIETGDEPLVVHEFSSVGTGYPFRVNGSFSSDDPELAQVWDVGWRTARMCAIDTYVDCPYYERLQYIGDTRIQGLISLYVAGDDRLLRSAIELFDQSRIPEGLTQSRYPSYSVQIINTFSLFWIGMVHDYWRHRDDPAFVEQRLQGTGAVLQWFRERVDAKTGMLGPLPFWTFVDWPDEWAWDEFSRIGGQPPGARTGGCAIATIQYAMALDQAADLFRAFGRGSEADGCAAEAAALRAAVKTHCWDDGRRLFADSPDKQGFSQHMNALAVLSGLVQGGEARGLIERAAADRTIVPATVYFRFYLLRALKAVGLGDRYLSELGPWRDMLALGLKTFAEKPEPVRSDCHAWSASPVYELLATVLGVEPGSPGFKTVRVEPHLGPLSRVAGVVPHPKGFVRVRLERAGEGVAGRIDLDGPEAGVFVWKGRELPLRPGVNEIRM
jgi:hypothetical protein